jgi:hypothetical protein
MIYRNNYMMLLQTDICFAGAVCQIRILLAQYNLFVASGSYCECKFHIVFNKKLIIHRQRMFSHLNKHFDKAKTRQTGQKDGGMKFLL